MGVDAFLIDFPFDEVKEAQGLGLETSKYICDIQYDPNIFTMDKNHRTQITKIRCNFREQTYRENFEIIR